MTHALAPLSTPTSADAGDDPVLARRWLLEVWLGRVRLWAAALVLVFAVVLDRDALPWIVLLGTAFGLVCTVLMRLVGAVPSPRLRLARWLGAGLDCAVVLSAIGLSARTRIHSLVPAVFLPLVLTMALRFGVAGIVSATSSLTLAFASLAEQHVVLGALPARDAIDVFGGWEVLILGQSLFSFVLLCVFRDWRRWQDEHTAHQMPAMSRLESGLSAREWELLPLLARHELTYDDIADELYMSPETVKTHVRRMAGKFDLTGQGRWKVVAEAHRRGLLSPTPDEPRPPE